MVKNINATRDGTCLRCFALCGFFSELQMERWISEQLQSLSAHSVARGPGGGSDLLGHIANTSLPGFSFPLFIQIFP